MPDRDSKLESLLFSILIDISGQFQLFGLHNVMASGSDHLLLPSDSQDRLCYRIDAQDNIVFLDQYWLRFASENSASPGLDPHAVIGHSIWDFVTGAESRHIYQQLFQRSRSEMLTLDIPFRCDSPTMRRYMRLEVHPLADCSLDIISTIVRLEPRDYMPLLDNALPRSDEFVYLCSWCKRIKASECSWLELEDGVSTLHLLEHGLPLPRISHVICPDCRDSLSLSISSGS